MKKKKKKKKVVADENWFKENKQLIEGILGYDISTKQNHANIIPENKKVK